MTLAKLHDRAATGAVVIMIGLALVMLAEGMLEQDKINQAQLGQYQEVSR